MKRAAALAPLAPLAALALACAPAACGPAPAASTPAPAAPVAQQEVVKNLGYFDVSTLAPSPPAVGGRVTNEVLLGVELAARPVLMECLVDPKNRGPGKSTRVVVDATFADGVQHQVSGTNLTPAGTACIEAALRAWAQGVPALAGKNAGDAVKSHLEFEHALGSSPAVELGVNDVSDVAGAIRLALPGWGDCFADWKSAPPHPLKATIKVLRPAGDAGTAAPVTPSEVTFDATADATAGKVAACLTGKIKALPVKAPQTESVTLPYKFSFVHSGLTDALPDAPTDVQLIQIDLQRARRTAEAAIADGERGLAASTYDDVVKRYKAKTTPAVSVAELKEKCAALLAADDKLIAAAGRLVATEEAAQGFTAAQKAKDPAWAEAEAKAAQSLAAAQKNVQGYRDTRKVDEGACPKVSF